MIPTRRLVVLAVLPLMLAAVSFWVWSALVPLIALDLVLVAVALVDLAANRGSVDVERQFKPIQAVGRPFEVVLRVRNTGRRTLRARLTDAAPGATEGLPTSRTIAAGRQVEVRYTVVADTRGEGTFGPVTLRWSSPLGLWERQRRHDVSGVVRIHPSFQQLRHHGLRAREDERRMPVRTRRRLGGENEFERLRPYVAGDAYRHIDWRATARKGDFITREFGQESNQNLILMLDAGRMMSGRVGAMTAFDHALDAALMLGQVALRHGDRVGLLAFDRSVRAWLAPRGGVRTGSRLIRGTYDLFPSLHEPDYALAFRHLSLSVRRRSLVVLFTSVVDEANATLTRTLVTGLGSRHLPLCVWMRDTEVDGLLDAPPGAPSVAYARGAAAELVAWREQSMAALRRRGALVVDAPADGLTPTLLSRYLEIKARRLL